MNIPLGSRLQHPWLLGRELAPPINLKFSSQLDVLTKSSMLYIYIDR